MNKHRDWPDAVAQEPLVKQPRLLALLKHWIEEYGDDTAPNLAEQMKEFERSAALNKAIEAWRMD